jgi:hypothetical protein
MNRRHFIHLTGSGAMIPTLAPALTFVDPHLYLRQDRPVPGDSSGADDRAFAASLVQGVARSFESLATNLGGVQPGDLFALIGFGGEFDTVDHASRGLEAIAGSFAEDVDEETVEVPVDPLGDERIGLVTTLPASVEDAGVDELAFGLLIVRKENILQVLIGISVSNTIDPVLAIARKVNPRWPSDDIWDAVPRLVDVPEGMVLTEEIANWTLEDFGLDFEAADPPAPLEEGALGFTVEIRLGGLAMTPDADGAFCSGAGYYAVVTAGATFRVLELSTGVELMSALLSPGRLQESTCSWKIAVLGLPPRDAYDFRVGELSLGTARYDDIANGETLVFELSR